jgi:hypothetical protein
MCHAEGEGEEYASTETISPLLHAVVEIVTLSALNPSPSLMCESLMTTLSVMASRRGSTWDFPEFVIEEWLLKIPLQTDDHTHVLLVACKLRHVQDIPIP